MGQQIEPIGPVCVPTEGSNECHLVNSPGSNCACPKADVAPEEKCIKLVGGYGSSACYREGSKPPKACPCPVEEKDKNAGDALRQPYKDQLGMPNLAKKH